MSSRLICDAHHKQAEDNDREKELFSSPTAAEVGVAVDDLGINNQGSQDL